MDLGTPRNIMSELHMTANQYNLVTTMYYVCSGHCITLLKSFHLTYFKITSRFSSTSFPILEFIPRLALLILSRYRT